MRPPRTRPSTSISPRLVLLLGGAAVLAVTGAAAGTVPPKPAQPAYARDVLPLFRGRCLGCHGPGHPAAGLDLSTRGDTIEGGHGGRAVTPGAPEKSLLYQYLADGRMPKGGARFTPAELKRVADWIRSPDARATTAGHWAFRSPKCPPVPVVRNAGRVRNPIDAFLLNDLERHGLAYSPEADRRTLIRRVTYDLIGLPPTPEEVDAYLADQRPDAYERVVDRLLADPRYGERWARYWLDTAGYAESEGVLQEDRVRPNAWRYRDYVIRSFNADKPYNQFLREQIAGDELVDYRHAPAFTPQVIDELAATGFLRTAVDATRDDFNPHQYGEYQYRMLNDMQTIVVSTTMGLTLQCARCHDHKYEPFSQKDYYRVQAIFAGGVRPRGKLLPTNRRQIVAATPTEQEQATRTNAQVDAALAKLTQQEQDLLREFRGRWAESADGKLAEADRAAVAAAVRTEAGRRTPAQQALAAAHKAIDAADAATLGKRFPEFGQGEAAIRTARAIEEKKRITYPEIRAFYDQDAAPPATQILVRGDWLHPGDPVEPGVPSVLDDPRHPLLIPAAGPKAETTGRRTAFAEWLTRPDHPLTARVIVNRVWAHHFGVGIVPTVENFGRSGTPPTNPALLDWLASSFVAETGVDGSGLGAHGSGGNQGPRKALRGTEAPPRVGEVGGRLGLNWSLKKLHRLLVTSSAYRQASANRAVGSRIDPEDHLLWRQRPHRLEAEAVRDGVLATVGALDPQMFGEPVPLEVQATGEITAAGEGGRSRRSIYLLVRRTQPVELLQVFDAPVMETNCTRRIVSTTATQALTLLNSGFLSAQSEQFARRLLKDTPAQETGLDHAPLIERAYRLALSRPPTAREAAAADAFLTQQTATYIRERGGAGEAARLHALADFCQALLCSNEFVYLD